MFTAAAPLDFPPGLTERPRHAKHDILI